MKRKRKKMYEVNAKKPLTKNYGTHNNYNGRFIYTLAREKHFHQVSKQFCQYDLNVYFKHDTTFFILNNITYNISSCDFNKIKTQNLTGTINFSYLF